MNKQTELQKTNGGKSQLELDRPITTVPIIQPLTASRQPGLLSRNGLIHFSTYQVINGEVE